MLERVCWFKSSPQQNPTLSRFKSYRSTGKCPALASPPLPRVNAAGYFCTSSRPAPPLPSWTPPQRAAARETPEVATPALHARPAAAPAAGLGCATVEQPFESVGSFLQAWGSGIQGKETKPDPDKTYIHIIAGNNCS